VGLVCLYASRQSDVHQLQRQSLQCSWTSSLELFPNRRQTAELVMQPFLTVAENVFGQWDQSAVWISLNCALEILGTYSLTYFRLKIRLEIECWFHMSLGWCHLSRLQSQADHKRSFSFISSMMQAYVFVSSWWWINLFVCQQTPLDAFESWRTGLKTATTQISLISVMGSVPNLAKFPNWGYCSQISKFTPRGKLLWTCCSGDALQQL